MTYTVENKMYSPKEVQRLLGCGRLVYSLMREMPGFQEINCRTMKVPGWGIRKWQEKKGFK